MAENKSSVSFSLTRSASKDRFAINMQIDKNWNIRYVFIIVLSCIFYIALWTSGHNWGGDFSAYIMQAVSIVDGTTSDFISQNSFTISESSSPVGPVAYPWGFPLLLAPVYAIFGMNFFAFKTVGLIFYIFFLITLWFGFRRFLKPNEMFFFLCLFALNPYMLKFGDHVLSDIPFLFFSTLSIVIMMQGTQGKSVIRDAAWLLFLGVAIGAAFLIRTNGILLIFVFLGLVGLSTAIRLAGHRPAALQGVTDPFHKYPAGVNFALLSMPVVLFSIITGIVLHILPDGQGSHIARFSEITFLSIAKNLYYYGFLFSDFFAPSKINLVGLSIYVISIPIVIKGLWSAWSDSLPIIFYSVLTLTILVLWPHTQGLRFIFPLLPFYIYFMIIGFRTISPLMLRWKIPSVLPFAALISMFALLSVFFACRNLSNDRVAKHGPFTQPAMEMFEYVKEHSSPDSIIVFRKPRVMRLFTGRSSLLYNKQEDFKYFDMVVIDKKSLYGQIATTDLDKVLISHPGKLVFVNDGFEIYEFVKNQ